VWHRWTVNTATFMVYCRSLERNRPSCVTSAGEKPLTCHQLLTILSPLLGSELTTFSLVVIRTNCMRICNLRMDLNPVHNWMSYYDYKPYLSTRYTCTISAYHHKSCEFEPCSLRGVLDKTLCDKICQWLAAGRWFSPGTPVSSTNKTDHCMRICNLRMVLSPVHNWMS
jgi:hypothetical protein